MFVKDHIAHRVIQNVIIITSDHFGFFVAFLFGNRFQELFLDLVEGCVAFLFAHAGFGDGVNLVVEFFVHAFAEVVVVGFVAVLAFRVGFFHHCGEVELGLHLHLDGFVGGVECFHHILFGDLLHLAFHHHDIVHGSGNDHVDVGFFHILDGGVDDHLTIDATDSHFGDGAVEGDVGDGECGGGGQASESIGEHVAVAGDERHKYLGVSVVVVREEGTEGAVNQAGDQNLVFRRTGFAFEETARETAHSGVLFLVFNLQRQKIGAFHCFFLGANGGQQHRVATLYNGSTIGLLGQLAGFDGDFSSVSQRKGLTYT